MRTITISVDEETYWLACARATELETTLPELGMEALWKQVREGSEKDMAARREQAERERMIAHDRRVRKMNEVIEKIRVESPGFKVADNLPREELYDRKRARKAAREAAKVELRAMLRDLE